MSLFLLILLFFSQPLASADCACIKDPHRSAAQINADRKQEYEKANAVFVGKVTANDGYIVTFKVAKSWKGPKQIVLSTGAVRGVDGTPLPEECSSQFHVGEEYLVYAYGPGDKLKASICSTLLLKDAAEEEKGLDEIKTHETIGRSGAL